MSARKLFDGMYVTAHYEHSKESRVMFQGLGVFGYDIRSKLYTMYWFDSFGFDPRGAATGAWAGNSLVLDRKDEFGFTRYIYTFKNEDRIRMEIQIGESDRTFQPWLTANWKRQGAY